MAYKDLAQQRAYQRRWVAAKRQRAGQQQPLSLVAWATQLQTLHADCDAAHQLLQQLEPDLMREAMAGRCLAAVSEVQSLVARGQACLKQAAAALTELEAGRRRLVAVVPEKQT